ncbi:MAG: ABC transporter permease [Lutisporaceae bacterium]
MVIESIERFFVQSWLSFKALFGWIEPKTYFFVKVVNPIFQLIFFCLLAKYCYNTNDLTRWVIGNSFLLCIYNCIFGIGNVFSTERFYGTLKIVIAAPSNKFLIFFQRGFVHIIDSLFTVSIGLLIGSILFNVSFQNVNMLLFFTVAIIAMFSAVGFGLFLGSFGMVASNMNLVMNIFAMLLTVFSGANFPIEWLPGIVVKFAYCLPITRSIKAANLLMTGASLPQVFSLMRQEILLGIIYIILGYIFIQIMERLAKERASLDIY